MLKSYFSNNFIEAGCDEAGRGCLAGPVCAAAVILPKDFSHPLLNDSKQLSEKKRELLRPIIEKEAVDYAVSFSSNIEIDEINILNASIATMHKALNELKEKFELILVDGNRFHRYKTINHECIVEGDAKFMSIAAASILAKTYRDEYMLELSKEFPVYDWHKNKGYPTPKHKAAIMEYGITHYHRKSFNLNFQAKIEFQ